MKILIAMLTTVALMPWPATAGSHETTTPRVTVNGTGTVQADPDRAVLRLGVLAQRETAQQVQLEANRVAGTILEAMRGLGIPGSAVQTSALDLQPVYTQRRPNQGDFVPEVAAYRATNTLEVTLDDLELVGTAIDRAIDAGANRVQGLTFSLRDAEAARSEAMRSAVENAAAKAGAIAKAVDRQLGTVIEVQEGGVRLRPVVARGHVEMAAADVGTPVASGQVTVSASVTVVYALSD